MEMIVSTGSSAAVWPASVLGLAAALAYAALGLWSMKAKPELPASHSDAATANAPWLLLLGTATLHSLHLLFQIGPFLAPHFGFGPALSVTACLVTWVYAVERRQWPQLRQHSLWAGLGAAAVLCGVFFPGQALKNEHSAVSAIHWALGLAAYGLFAAAVVHAWLMRRSHAQMRTGGALGTQAGLGVPLLALESLMFRFLWAGFAVLSITLILGFLTTPAGQLRFNHKVVLSLLAWSTFLMLLMGRLAWGWRGLKATRFVYGGFALLLLAYVGSRFVLEVILQR
jgi:ABC-type uncharacterized transport system permease subunit